MCLSDIYFCLDGLAFPNIDGQYYSYKGGVKNQVTDNLLFKAKMLSVITATEKDLVIGDFIIYKDQIYQLVDVDELGRPVIYSTYDEELIIMHPMQDIKGNEIFQKLFNPWENFFKGETSYNSLIPLSYMMSFDDLAYKYLYDHIINNEN